MDDDLDREWRRWAAAEAEGRHDEADAAFGALFKAVPVRAAAGALNEHVAEAVARVAVRQARLARAVAVAGSVFGVALAIGLLLQLPRLLRASLDLSVSAIVWLALAFDRGLDAWTIVAQIGRTVGSVIVAPPVTLALIGLGLIALAALYALHRMLDVEERSSLSRSPLQRSSP